MIAFTMTWPRAMFTARRRTRAHDAGQLVAHETEVPREDGRQVDDHVELVGPALTASSAATTLVRGGVGTVGERDDGADLHVGAPEQPSAHRDTKCGKHADGGEVVRGRLATEPLDVRRRAVGAKQGVVDRLGEFLGVHALGLPAGRLRPAPAARAEYSGDEPTAGARRSGRPRRQCLRTLTRRSRNTCTPRIVSISCRAPLPIALTTRPPLPTTMAFCDSVSTMTLASISTSGRSVRSVMDADLHGDGVRHLFAGATQRLLADQLRHEQLERLVALLALGEVSGTRRHRRRQARESTSASPSPRSAETGSTSARRRARAPPRGAPDPVAVHQVDLVEHDARRAARAGDRLRDVAVAGAERPRSR